MAGGSSNGQPYPLTVFPVLGIYILPEGLERKHLLHKFDVLSPINCCANMEADFLNDFLTIIWYWVFGKKPLIRWVVLLAGLFWKPLIRQYGDPEKEGL